MVVQGYIPGVQVVLLQVVGARVPMVKIVSLLVKGVLVELVYNHLSVAHPFTMPVGVVVLVITQPLEV
tara:strand:- start:5 stop:208 length:204 start_codon:yes stop_codon:yes gene_type:complete